MKNAIDNNWLDPKVLVAVYAAIVSTCTLFWNIITLVLKNMKKLKIDVLFLVSDGRPIVGEIPNFSPAMKIKITNQCNTTLFIENIGLCFNENIEYFGKTKFFWVSDFEVTNEKIPYELFPGYLYERRINLTTFWKNIGIYMNNKNSGFYIIIKDTFGEMYKTK